MRKIRWLAAWCSLCGLLFGQTSKRPVVDEYHGVKVTDDYRWLEAWSDETKAWSNAQNAAARRYLDGLPARAGLREQIQKVLTSPAANFRDLQRGGAVWFALRVQPPKEQPFLVTLASLDDVAAPRTIVDPVQVDASGHTSIDFYQPSPDGKYVAVSLSQGGSESGDLSIFETASGRKLDDHIARVSGGTAGGSVAWTAEGRGFYYTRYPRKGERPEADVDFYQQIWYHKLGTPEADDRYALGKDFPRIAEIVLQAEEGGPHILARVANGDGGDFTHYLLTDDGEWRLLAGLAEQVSEVTFGKDGSFYLLSHKGAPKGQVLRLPPGQPDLRQAKTIVPESDAAIESLQPVGRRLYLRCMDGGPSVIRVYSTDGKREGTVPAESNSAVYQLMEDGAGGLLFNGASYVTPSAWYRYDAAAKRVTPTALRRSYPVDYSDMDVRREFAVSKDGTRVPMTILCRKGTALNGENPVLLTGYGGYNISLPPVFDPTLRPLFDRHVVYVVANLRGGGEYGEAWHTGGNLTRKQHVFDDFEACARHLLERNYTKPARLAIIGGSNGGLLMGAAFTQHPGLYGAVVSEVGIYDMLRVELSPNGAFNVTEFGTVKEQDQFRALYAYSPYHHVKDGTQYPAILFVTGENDPRVDPMNSRKMTARLQASGTQKPVLLRTSSNAGHGFGTALSEQIDQLSDIYAFLFAQWDIHPRP